MRTGSRRIAVALAIVFASGLLAGCGERAQVIAYKSGKYQGKPDGKPYENEPGAALYTTSKWTGGDKAPPNARKAKFYLKRAFLYGFEFRGINAG